MSNITLPSADKFGIKSEVAAQIKAQFDPMLATMEALEAERNTIIDQAQKEVTPEVVLKAKELLGRYVKVRTGTAAIHKEQKAYYLQMGRFVDAWKNVQIAASTDSEKSLESIVKHFENLEAARIEKLRADRWAKLSQFKETEPDGLGQMEEDVFHAYLTMAQQQHQDRLEAEARAEAERQRQALADKREREILHLRNFWPEQMPHLGDVSAEVFADIVKGCEAREKEYIAEQERIARERAELERKAREEAQAREAERKAAEAREAKLREEAEAIRKAAQEKADAERKAAEARERAAREEAEKREAAAREEAARIERERIAAEQAEAARIEAERIAKEAAERAARDEATKLREMAAHRPEWPNLASEEAEWIRNEYAKLLDKAQGWVEKQINAKLK